MQSVTCNRPSRDAAHYLVQVPGPEGWVPTGEPFQHLATAIAGAEVCRLASWRIIDSEGVVVLEVATLARHEVQS